MNNTLHCPVTGISGVWRFKRNAGLHTLAHSTQGHLLHYIVKGVASVVANGRTYNITAGDVIYYYEQEEVRTRFVKDTIFYSIAFSAPELLPLSLSQRVFKLKQHNLMDIFASIYDDMYTRPHAEIELSIFQKLFKLLSIIGFAGPGRLQNSPREKLWNQVETWIRSEHNFRVGIKEICSEFKISPATLHRVCRDAVGNTVAARIRQMRMEEGKALLTFSDLNVSETAQYLGYPRIHEFSREFSGYFKRPPSSFKQNNIKQKKH